MRSARRPSVADDELLMAILPRFLPTVLEGLAVSSGKDAR